MNMELLQLATLLIRRATGQLIAHRKELIKFGWNHLKRDDSAAKHYAFINVAHFLEAYQAPEKIVLQARPRAPGGGGGGGGGGDQCIDMASSISPLLICFIPVLVALKQPRLARQVFVALLRNCQPDTRRHLVLQALDTLTPALVRRLDPGDARFPTWVRYTKKVLVEEGNSMVHLVHIWQLIVRHPQLFFSSRCVPPPCILHFLVPASSSPAFPEPSHPAPSATAFPGNPLESCPAQPSAIARVRACAGRSLCRRWWAR